MTWPMPSKPCLWLHGPPAPNAVTVVRMMSGFTRLRLSRSSESERKTSGGRFATTTSAVATSFLTISRPSGEDGSSVMPRLLRFMVTYSAPIPSSLIGATHRSSPPPIRSMRITSAPRSAWSAARIDDERALVLARDVGVDAHHPRVDLGEEHPSAGVVHVLEPVALRLGRRLHARVTPVAHVCDERGHPVHVLLDAARDV